MKASESSSGWRKMRFTIKHILVATVWFAFVFTAAGYSGAEDAFLFGILTGGAMYFAIVLLFYSKTMSFTEKSLFLLGLFVAIVGLVFGFLCVRQESSNSMKSAGHFEIRDEQEWCRAKVEAHR
jgi:di/tricarboxylate transporter